MDSAVHHSCPFCGLGCADGRAMNGQFDKKFCSWAAQGFASAGVAFQDEASPQLNGRNASLDEAVAAAAELLESSASPLFASMVADVASLKGAFALAEQMGAIISAPEALMANGRAMQNRGIYAGSLHECAARCDVIMLFAQGDDIPPRLMNVCLNPPKKLSKKRKVILIGEGLKKMASACDSILWELPASSWLDALAFLRLSYEESSIPPKLSSSLARAPVADIIKSLKESSYACMMWQGASLEGAKGEIMGEAIASWVDMLNLEKRFVALPLSAMSNGAALMQISSWQTGYLPRLSYAHRSIRYEPYLYQTERLIEAQLIDLLLWVDVWNKENTPPAEQGFKSIVLGRAGMTFATPPAVYIPCQSAGIDGEGVFFRFDGASSIVLSSLADSSLPSVAHICARLLEEAT